MLLKRSITARLALAVAAVVTAVTLGPLGRAHAQTPPTRFYGALMINGQPAPAGTELKGFVNGQECGSATISEDGKYVLDVMSWGTIEGCGNDEDTVEFQISGVTATPGATFQTGHFVQLDLAADMSAPPVPEPAPEAVPAPPAEPGMDQPAPAPDQPGDSGEVSPE